MFKRQLGVVFLLLALLAPLSVLAQDSFDDFDKEFKPNQEQSWDPLKPYNVQMTRFNDFVYINMLGPVTKGYKRVVNKPVRKSVSNFFANLGYPIRFVNNLLQFKVQNSFEETMRFIINSTFGMAGLFDVAQSEGGLKPHPEDFGQTLGFYGVSGDIHLVLPLLGPSNLRDTIGKVTDSFVDPVNYDYNHEKEIINRGSIYYGSKGLDTINDYSFRVNDYENLREDAINLYELLKSAYNQRRVALIKE